MTTRDRIFLHPTWYPLFVLILVFLPACQPPSTESPVPVKTSVYTPSPQKTVDVEAPVTSQTKLPLSTEITPVGKSPESSYPDEPDLPYPLPESGEGKPNPSPTISESNSPTLALMPTPTPTRIPTSTPEGAYPLPEYPDLVGSGDDSLTQDPYPGPDDQGPPAQEETQPQGESLSPEGQASPTESAENPPGVPSAPTAIPATGKVRTGLVATDPADFTLASGEIQLVEFYAVWAPLSLSMAPVMNSLEDQYKGTIRFVYLDIDDPANALFKLLLGGRLPPVFFLLDGDGRVVHEWQGFVKREVFEAVFGPRSTQ